MAENNSTPEVPEVPDHLDSFEAFKAAESKKSAKAAAPVQQRPDSKEVPSAEAQPAKETAEDPDTSSAQGKEKPKRKPDAEHRIQELLREQRERDAEIARLKSENETIRKTGVKQDPPPAPDKPVPATEAKPSASTDAEPDLDEYFRKYPDESMGKVQQRFNRDHYAWMKRQDEAAATAKQAETARAEMQRKTQEKVNAAIAKHPDFQAKCGELSTGRVIHRDALIALRDVYDNGMDVLYELGSNPSEAQRIAALPPLRQVAEVGILALKLAASASDPEKPSNVRPISRLPAPQKHVLGGSMPAPQKSLAEATSYEEAKAIEKARLAGGR